MISKQCQACFASCLSMLSWMPRDFLATSWQKHDPSPFTRRTTCLKQNPSCPPAIPQTGGMQSVTTGPPKHQWEGGEAGRAFPVYEGTAFLKPSVLSLYLSLLKSSTNAKSTRQGKQPLNS